MRIIYSSKIVPLPCPLQLNLPDVAYLSIYPNISGTGIKEVVVVPKSFNHSAYFMFLGTHIYLIVERFVKPFKKIMMLGRMGNKPRCTIIQLIYGRFLRSWDLTTTCSVNILNHLKILDISH